MFRSATPRYVVAIVSLVFALIFSVRYSDRGVLFDPHGSELLAGAPETPDDYALDELPILNRVLLQMRDNYVAPERIDAARMLVRSLDRVQNTVPELVALFNDNLDGNPTSVEIRVGSHAQSFDISGIGSLWEMSFKLREIFRFVEEHIDREQTDLRDLEYAAINGMLSTLDPHSVLLTPDIFEEMQTSNRGVFGGLGIVISIRASQLTVISPIDDTPADRAGLRSGDRIVKINEESTVNMPLDDAVGRLRGPIGSDVTIEVMRQGWSEPHSFTLTREQINIESVKYHALGDGIGYVEISNFQDNTHTDLVAALNALREEMGELNGLVLDLRNNPGGLLTQAIEVSDTFLDEGAIVTTVGAGDRMRDETLANRGDTEPNYPIVVLVNPGSASASEIVAGALKNHDRALIVGDQTFGKGSVQILYDYPDGSALKLTVAQYLTPGDISIQGVGIAPDIQLFGAIVNDEVVDLYPNIAEQVREGDLETRLTSTYVAGDQSRPSAMLRYRFEPEEVDPEAIEDPEAFESDFEIDFAVQVLLEAGSETWERNALLAAAMPVVDRIAAEQSGPIREALRELGIDWEGGSNVIQPLTLSATMPEEGGRALAGETLELVVSATNNGDRPLHQVRATTQSDHPLLDDREVVFGRIEAGETATFTLEVDLPLDEESRIEAVRFEAFADNVDLESTTEALIEIAGRARPHWGITYYFDDTTGGNGDGLLQVGETVNAQIAVTNTGEGDAGNTIFIIRNQSESSIFLRSGRSEVESVARGETETAQFEFSVQARPEDGIAGLDLEVFDEDFREYLREELRVPIELVGAVSTAADGTFVVSEAAAILGGAADYASPVANAPAGARLRFDRTTDGWYHVVWDEGSGWLPASAGSLDDGAAQPDGVENLVALSAPQIRITTDTLRTDAATVDIRAELSDDAQVLDYYVVVENGSGSARPEALKRWYEYLGRPTAEVSTTVPLREGFNRITLVARDSERATSSQTVYVYRHD